MLLLLRIFLMALLVLSSHTKPTANQPDLKYEDDATRPHRLRHHRGELHHKLLVYSKMTSSQEKESRDRSKHLRKDDEPSVWLGSENVAGVDLCWNFTCPLGQVCRSADDDHVTCACAPARHCTGRSHKRRLTCGSDGRVYLNRCELHRAACQSGRHVDHVIATDPALCFSERKMNSDSHELKIFRTTLTAGGNAEFKCKPGSRKAGSGSASEYKHYDSSKMGETEHQYQDSKNVRSPSAQIIWNRNGHQIIWTEDSNFRIFEDGSLSIQDVGLQHIGRYSCHVVYQRTSIKRPPEDTPPYRIWRETFPSYADDTRVVEPLELLNYSTEGQQKIIYEIHVQTAPQVQVNPSTQFHVIRNTALIRCHVDSHPPPTKVTWFVNELPLVKRFYLPGYFNLQDDNRTLILPNVTTLRHTGAYKCLAESSGGRLRGQDIATVFVERSDVPQYAKVSSPYESYVAFHSAGFTSLDPQHCSAQMSVLGNHSIESRDDGRTRPGAGDRKMPLCGAQGLCHWGSAVSVLNRYIYAAQPREKRVVVIDITKQLKPIEVIPLEDHPLDLYYIEQYDQVWILTGSRGQGDVQTREGAGKRTVLVLRHASDMLRRHSPVHLQPIQNHFLQVGDLFLPSAIDGTVEKMKYGYATKGFHHSNQSDTNQQQHQQQQSEQSALQNRPGPKHQQQQKGDQQHQGQQKQQHLLQGESKQQMLYKLNLEKLKVIDILDLSPYNCSPVSVAFIVIGGKVMIECFTGLRNSDHSSRVIILDYLTNAVLFDSISTAPSSSSPSSSSSHEASSSPSSHEASSSSFALMKSSSSSSFNLSSFNSSSTSKTLTSSNALLTSSEAINPLGHKPNINSTGSDPIAFRALPVAAATSVASASISSAAVSSVAASTAADTAATASSAASDYASASSSSAFAGAAAAVSSATTFSTASAAAASATFSAVPTAETAATTVSEIEAALNALPSTGRVSVFANTATRVAGITKEFAEVTPVTGFRKLDKINSVNFTSSDSKLNGISISSSSSLSSSLSSISLPSNSSSPLLSSSPSSSSASSLIHSSSVSSIPSVSSTSASSSSSSALSSRDMTSEMTLHDIRAGKPHVSPDGRFLITSSRGDANLLHVHHVKTLGGIEHAYDVRSRDMVTDLSFYATPYGYDVVVASGGNKGSLLYVELRTEAMEIIQDLDKEVARKVSTDGDTLHPRNRDKPRTRRPGFVTSGRFDRHILLPYKDSLLIVDGTRRRVRCPWKDVPRSTTVIWIDPIRL